MMGFLLYIISLVVINCESEIVLDYVYDYSLPYTEMTYIKDNFTVKNLLNTYLPYSILDNYFFDKIKKQIDTNKTILHFENDYESSLFIMNLSFNKIDIYNTSVYQSNFISFIPDLGISLSYKFEDESYSIVHQLYNQHKISKRQFAFIPFQYRKKGQLYIGNMNINNYTNEGYFNVDDKYSTWGSNITGMTINGNKREVNEYCFIHSGFEEMISSNLIFNYMKEEFKEEIDNEICSITTNVGEESCIICKEYVDRNDSIFIIEIGNMTITLTFEDLFKQSMHEWKSKFISNPYKQYNNHTLLGSIFIQMFDVVLFDYDSNQVRLFSNKIKIEMNIRSNNVHIVKMLICLTCIMLVINSLLLVMKRI